MKSHRLTDTVQYLGAPHYDRRLFDSLIPIPDGTSYNAYLVTGSDKTVLIDTVEPLMAGGLLELLADVPRIDHVISLHAEQDHSGTIPQVLDRYPDATVLCSPKAKTMLGELLHLPLDRVTTVADGDTLSLGDRTLRFLHTPWVHWPETMAAYLEEEQVLFSCDLFGSHLACSAPDIRDEMRLLDAAKRYYAGIMMPFSKFIDKHLTKLDDFELAMIAPSHGPVHRPPTRILDAYRSWVRGPLADRVVVVYETMHSSTEAMVHHLAGALVDRGVEVEPHRLTDVDLGKLAMSLLDAATILYGTPTVHAGPHPQVVYAAYLVAALRPPAKTAGIIASSGWAAGRTTKIITELSGGLKAEWLDPVLCKGMPTAADLKSLDDLADAIVKRHTELGLRGEAP